MRVTIFSRNESSNTLDAVIQCFIPYVSIAFLDVESMLRTFSCLASSPIFCPTLCLQSERVPCQELDALFVQDIRYCLERPW